MKIDCSFKTIGTIFTALILMIAADMALAGPLTEREEVMLNTYMADRGSRTAIRMEYWTDVRKQSERIQRGLPTQLSPNVYMVAIEYDGSTSVKYVYYTDDPSMNVDIIKERVLDMICLDPQVALLLTIMDGSMSYDYYLYPNNKTVWQTFSISRVDCSGPGI